MTPSLDQLPAAARVWIYQASRQLTEAELTAAAPALTEFVAGWNSHGQALRTGAAFLHEQFLVIGLDESQAGASGCSIDASVHFVRALEEKWGVGMLDKSRLAFLVDGTVELRDRRELREAAVTGALTVDSLYFDNTIATVGQLRAAWPAPAGQTWLRKYFVAVASNVVGS